MLPGCNQHHTVHCAGLPHVNPSNWVQVEWDTVDWMGFLNVMFW